MSRRACVLIVEDDAAIRRGMADALDFDGFEVLQAGDGHAGMNLARQAGYDLLLLDLVLPGPGGLEILADVRMSRPTMPVIILTAKGEEADRVRGLRLGADDYVVKPFSVRELLARIHAVLRRSPGRPSGAGGFEFHGGRVDLESGALVYHDGTEGSLSERETALLRYLLMHHGRVISRDEILQHVWRLDPRHIETRTIDMHVMRLREKLGDRDGKVLRTIRAKGYVLEPVGKKPS